MENFKENTAFKLNDGNKYWVVKRVKIENIVFYHTIKMAKHPEVFVFADGDELKVVEDEEILQIVATEVLKTIQN